MLTKWKAFGAQLIRHSGLAACIVLAIIISWRVADASLFQAARLAVFDSYQQAESREYQAAPFASTILTKRRLPATIKGNGLARKSTI